MGSAWLWLASTCFEYLDKYGEAPRLNIEPIWESENRLDPDAKAELGRLLSGLSKECEKDERLNSKYLLEQARRHFQRGLFLPKVLEIEAAAEAGELERANEVLRELNEGNEKIAAASAGPLKGTTARELLQMEIMEPEWVVQGIIPTGLTLLAGRPKSGKSYFMINLAAQLAAGGKVFNAVESKPSRVLYLGLEDPKWRIQKRLHEVLGDGDDGHPDNLHFFSVGEWPKLNQGGMGMLREIQQDRRKRRLVSESYPHHR